MHGGQVRRVNVGFPEVQVHSGAVQGNFTWRARSQWLKSTRLCARGRRRGAIEVRRVSETRGHSRRARSPDFQECFTAFFVGKPNKHLQFTTRAAWMFSRAVSGVPGEYPPRLVIDNELRDGQPRAA